MGKISKTGWLVVEMKRLQDRNAVLEAEMRPLQKRLRSLEDENKSLRGALYGNRPIRRPSRSRDSAVPVLIKGDCNDDASISRTADDELRADALVS